MCNIFNCSQLSDNNNSYNNNSSCCSSLKVALGFLSYAPKSTYVLLLSAFKIVINFADVSVAPCQLMRSYGIDSVVSSNG